MKKSTPSALFIGRFQPFHLGHLDVVEQALQENEFVIIGIGSAENNYLPDNPFTASERWEMIQAALDEKKISRERTTIIPVRNIDHYALWVEHVSKLLPPFSRVYTGSPMTQQLFRDHGQYEVIPVQFKISISGTQIREWMRADDPQWKQFIPQAVAKKIHALGGTERLKNIIPL